MVEPILPFHSYLHSCLGKVILPEQEIVEFTSGSFSCIKVEGG